MIRPLLRTLPLSAVLHLLLLLFLVLNQFELKCGKEDFQFASRQGMSVIFEGSGNGSDRPGETGSGHPVAGDTGRHAGSDQNSGAASGRSGVISARISDLKLTIEYPELARRQAMQGRVIVAFRIRDDGRVDHVHIVQSSGYGILDESALHSISTWTFEPGNESDHNVPIVFRLN